MLSLEMQFAGKCLIASYFSAIKLGKRNRNILTTGNLELMDFYCCGATAQFGPRTPYC
jgi:hypothetical protein